LLCGRKPASATTTDRIKHLLFILIRLSFAVPLRGTSGRRLAFSDTSPPFQEETLAENQCGHHGVFTPSRIGRESLYGRPAGEDGCLEKNKFSAFCLTK
jgi:hypothetical protein